MTEQLSKENCLKHYLECEKLLGDLFVKSKFCYEDCTSKLISRYPTRQPGNVGCCHGNFYLSSDVETESLDKERENIYGKFKQDNEVISDTKKICDYHSPKGCLTPTHKSPKCVAFICSAYEKYLFDKYNVGYNYKKLKKSLLDVLGGKLSIDNIEDFKNELRNNINLIDIKD